MIKYLFTFVGGAALGAFAMHQYDKRYMDDIIDEEIEKAKEHYKDIFSESDSRKSPVEKSEKTKPEMGLTKTPEKPALSEYVKHLQNNGYGVTTDDIPTREKRKRTGDIELIPEQEFGREDEYDEITLTWHQPDNTLEEDYDIWDDEMIDIHIGREWMDAWDENDAAYVVNHERKIYYEILKDLDPYSGPTKVEVDYDEDK